MAIEVDAPCTTPVWRIARPSRAAVMDQVVRENGAAHDTARLIWRSPGVWLAAGDGAQDVASRLADRTDAALMELTGAVLFWRVNGTWMDLLAHGSALDPADQTFKARGVAWTRFRHFEIGVVRSPEAAVCHVIGARSVARDLDWALRRAARHAEILP